MARNHHTPLARRGGTTASGKHLASAARKAAAHVDVVKKYEALVVRHEALVRCHGALQRANEDLRVRQGGAAVIALAAMRAPVTGIAFVRRDAIIERNLRFLELEQNRQGWRRESRQDGGPAPLLGEVVLSASARLADGNGPRAFLARHERADGGQTIDMRVERIGSVTPPLVMATVVDVTESIRAASEVEEARRGAFEQERLRAVGELASGVAHDFNNTLNAMGLWISRLGQAELPPSERQRAVDVVARIVSDAAVRVGQLQDFSRSRYDEPMESLSLGDVVRQAIELFRAEVEGRRLRSGAAFETEARVPGDLPRVRGSAAELRHVFLNLLLNARDAMPRGGRVVVEATCVGGRVVVTVEDEGTGIPEQNLPRVFDPFFTTKGRRGTGLGLSIAEQVMQRLGGSIAAANGPRGGAVFRLTFPVVRSEEVPSAAPLRTPPPGPGKHVLVVDDDADNLEATLQVLEGLGQRVTLAQSGAEALERLRGTLFDLVLCDVGMPGMNGWQVAERIREMAPGTPVYMVSGWANEFPPDDPHRALVEGVLAKPLALESLASLVGVRVRSTPPVMPLDPT